MFERKLQELQRVVDAGVENLQRLGERAGESFANLSQNPLRRLRRDLRKDRLEGRCHLQLAALRYVRQDVPKEMDLVALPCTPPRINAFA